MSYDIFREEIAKKYSLYGHALWEPSPGGHYTAVEIGDVGFIREGRFHRLFNILLSGDDPSHQGGVPQRHEPLVLSRTRSPIDTSTLWPNDLRSNGVLDRAEEHRRRARGPDEATQVSFACSRRRGAILSLPMPAQRKDTTARGAFAKFIIKHIDEWFAFAREGGLGISREDIILVTGCHLTRTWATIAFREEGEQVSFGVQVSGVSDVMWQFTREGAQGVAYNLGPSGQNLPENQCIFIRGFRVTRFSMIIPRLRAAAGPAQLPDEDDPNTDTQLESIPDETHYQDPLRTILEYIATEAPGCDMALVHDDDLQYIDTTSLESLRPDTVMSYLRRSAPKIWRLSCDISPTSHGDENQSKSEVPSRITVAALSKLDIAHELEPAIARNRIQLEERVTSPSNHRGDRKILVSPKSGDTIPTTFLNAVGKHIPSTRQKEERGDAKLEQVRDLILGQSGVRLDESSLRVFEDKITYAREEKIRLNSESGIQKWLHARKYHEYTQNLYREAKYTSERTYDRSQFQSQASKPEDPVIKTARSLYRCWLSCKDAFPSSLKKDDWARHVWNEACYRTKAPPNLLRQDEEFTCSSMAFLTDMKREVKHAVESSYEFNTSKAPDSISRNTSRAQALLANMTFVYREFNFGGRPRYPYQHPIIQKVINVTWFDNKDDGGIVFHEYFDPIPFEVIALALTVIEWCLNEWSTGTYRESMWKEEDCETHYHSHLNSLRDLSNVGRHQKGYNHLVRIQVELLKNARLHAGAPPYPVTGSGRIARDTLESDLQDDFPEYDHMPKPGPEAGTLAIVGSL